MKIRVNPTRMELMRLKKRLELAQRGHKLLKDKLEALSRVLITMIEPYKKLRSGVDAELIETLKQITLAGILGPTARLSGALAQAAGILTITLRQRMLMGIHLSEVAGELSPGTDSYSSLDTAPEVDVAAERLRALLSRLLQLVTLENSIRLVAIELQLTRRRSNALEYVLIPELSATIKSISYKLAELERSNTSRLMFIKNKIRSRSA
ncbi:MAG: V-type ATP synthase subunit D [Planctomycetia bacterium]|nr:V-type ATP synthase subunit D [Planctomycetia bacterium]